jgi:hypothetical protein
MNHTVALESQTVDPTGLGDLLALVGFPSKRKLGERLAGTAEDILRDISSFLDSLLLHAISAQTRGEFIAFRKKSFTRYAEAVISFAKLVRIIVSDSVIEKVLTESFCELEFEVREHGLERFGAPARDQAMFTVWTLRRTSRLISKIVAAGPTPDSLKQQDEKLARDLGLYVTWTQFHLDCFLAAIRFNKPIQLDVLPGIIDGLRAAVNAYGYAREGLNLRVPQEELLITPYEWDGEDQELLDSSMRDMEVHSVDD